MFNVKKWISTTNKGNRSYEHEPQDEDDDGIKPSDSVSEVMTHRGPGRLATRAVGACAGPIIDR